MRQNPISSNKAATCRLMRRPHIGTTVVTPRATIPAWGSATSLGNRLPHSLHLTPSYCSAGLSHQTKPVRCRLSYLAADIHKMYFSYAESQFTLFRETGYSCACLLHPSQRMDFSPPCSFRWAFFGSVALSNFCQKMALISLNNFCWELLNATEPHIAIQAA